LLDGDCSEDIETFERFSWDYSESEKGFATNAYNFGIIDSAASTKAPNAFVRSRLTVATKPDLISIAWEWL
jgi:hypothetical protein